jgi:hypothetical protein
MILAVRKEDHDARTYTCSEPDRKFVGSWCTLGLGAGRGAAALPAGWRGPAADAGGHAPAASLGAGLPPCAQAGAHDRRLGRGGRHWPGAPGRGHPVSAAQSGIGVR